MKTLVKAGWRVIREWQNRFGNHWILLTPDNRVWSGVDNVKNKSEAWRRLRHTVPPDTTSTNEEKRQGDDRPS